MANPNCYSLPCSVFALTPASACALSCPVVPDADSRSCSLPRSSVHGTSQARTQKWDLFDPGIKPASPTLVGRFFTSVAPGILSPVYCHPASLTYTQSTSSEMLGWMAHKLESRLPGEISTISDIDDTTRTAESEEELRVS